MNHNFVRHDRWEWDVYQKVHANLDVANLEAAFFGVEVGREPDFDGDLLLLVVGFSHSYMT